MGVGGLGYPRIGGRVGGPVPQGSGQQGEAVPRLPCRQGQAQGHQAFAVFAQTAQAIALGLAVVCFLVWTWPLLAKLASKPSKTQTA